MTEDGYVCVDRGGRKEEMQDTLGDPHTPVSRHFRTTDKGRLSSYLSIYLPQFVCFSSAPSVRLLQQQTESNNNNDSSLVAGEDPPGCNRGASHAGQRLTPMGPASRTGLKKQIRRRRRRPSCHESLNICEAR